MVIHRVYLKCEDFIGESYFFLLNWYVLSFIIAIILSLIHPYPFTLWTIYLIITCLVTYKVCHKYALVRFILLLIVFFCYGIIATQYRQYSITHTVIGKTSKAKITGKILSLKPYFDGLQGVIEVHHIVPNIINQDEYIRINFKNLEIEKYFIGDIIEFEALLSPPPQQMVPSGYDFSFYAYYSQLSAVGRHLGKEIKLYQNDQNYGHYIQNLKRLIFARLIHNLGKQNGNFTSAILLGEGKGLDATIMDNMRYSGISHILCVSGLHLSLVSMMIYFSCRTILNCSNSISYYLDIKTISASVALIGSYFYLLLSGNQIAASRAFVMTGLVMTAIIVARIPDVVRALSISALIILSLNPEFVFHPSFQLSFIAVLSLVRSYEYYVHHIQYSPSYFKFLNKIKLFFVSNLYTSLVASLATAPLVIYHFYIFSNYSILANLVAVPIMSIFVMPLALLSLVAMPIGLDGYMANIMGVFIEIIINSASYFRNLEGSLWYFGHIESSSFAIYLIGFFILCFMQNRARKIGVIIILISSIFMMMTERPDMIINMKKKIVGLRNEEGDFEIYRATKNKFIENYWTTWYGVKEAKAYILDLKSENFFYHTVGGAKIFVASKKYECVKSDLFLNYINDKSCALSKQNFVKADLQDKESIVVYCTKDRCKVSY